MFPLPALIKNSSSIVISANPFESSKHFVNNISKPLEFPNVPGKNGFTAPSYTRFSCSIKLPLLLQVLTYLKQLPAFNEHSSAQMCTILFSGW